MSNQQTEQAGEQAEKLLKELGDDDLLTQRDELHSRFAEASGRQQRNSRHIESLQRQIAELKADNKACDDSFVTVGALIAAIDRQLIQFDAKDES